MGFTGDRESRRYYWFATALALTVPASAQVTQPSQQSQPRNETDPATAPGRGAVDEPAAEQFRRKVRELLDSGRLAIIKPVHRSNVCYTNAGRSCTLSQPWVLGTRCLCGNEPGTVG